MGNTSARNKSFNQQFDWDVVVIGGGSGGISAAKQCARYGKKVMLCDYVKPTAFGKTWGLGGTCVNVGCIPKKLMHIGSCFSILLQDAASYGWMKADKASHNWNILIEGIQHHIHYLNFGLRLNLTQSGVAYQNGFCCFEEKNPHSLLVTDRHNAIQKFTSRYIILAVGGRPQYMEIQGFRSQDKVCITSDEIFSLEEKPETVVIIGGSYIAVECAGFLNHLGCAVTMVVRGLLLRHMDRCMVKHIKEELESNGIDIFVGWSPKALMRNHDDTKTITIAENKTGECIKLTCKQVILAIGRQSNAQDLNPDAVGLKLDEKTDKVIVNKYDQTNIKDIFAIGDCALGRPGLTPTAIKAGQLLADRLFGHSKSTVNYALTPSTVFTPIEYGFVGMTEEQASKSYGDNNIEIYHSSRQPLEFILPDRNHDSTIFKVIAMRSGTRKILGFHYYGPNAGEIIQGFASAMNAGITKPILDSTIGIHPTTAEEFTSLTTTKRSGLNFRKSIC